MFKVKLMRPEDFSFATELANTMDWNMATEDFQFMIQLEPDGCFVLFDGSKHVGIATCISYGKVGWFGNLVVKEEYRRKGAGSLLVKHAIDYLRGKGAETIGLYAYPNLINFYGNLGFKADEDYALLHAQLQKTSRKETLPQIGKQKIQAITKFDRECFGGDRTKLLESIILEKGNLSYYKSAGTKVVGYVAATVYETMAWVGPLMCQEGNIDVAVTLLKAVLAKLTGKSVYVALPKKETALADMLFTLGFKEDFSVVRMFFGPVVAKNCIYLAESLERG
ncbi:MAG: GNAT family N-acetyltransferase [Candidatus Bathyarchaeota archaeon]|nr:GNAT family N-acetyltransferase [Candidatus Bathyarchaeota archaeon]